MENKNCVERDHLEELKSALLDEIKKRFADNELDYKSRAQTLEYVKELAKLLNQEVKEDQRSEK